ncbi:hypothetical protein ANANG_G00002510 [Anguilla anguilla]|uniref:Ig-like domain-containing protein n=1 Tax=Anguilla anguilla TaxID=7936 RepID=A0A9D3SAJ2_ANGAN|nr:hypothetical protein ANANG_G00002510 [Anguilla anguilla]
MTSRGQPVKESAVALMCRSQSYPPIRSYKWHIQKDVNAKTLLRPGQNLTIGSDEEGTYYCSAENEISSSSSDSIEIRFDRSSTRTLIMATSCFFVVIIILVIVIVILLYRKRRKSARQRLENGSRSDTWETLVMDGMGGPQRSRETLSTVMAPPPGPPANQHGHDSELYASPHTVNSPLKFPEKTKQAKPSGLPHRDGGGPAEEDGINYASLQFPGKGNRMDPKPEETECVYSKLAKPIRKQEVEAEEAEYENVKEAVPRWTERESDSDSETSDEDPDVCYTTVSFAPQAGPRDPAAPTAKVTATLRTRTTTSPSTPMSRPDAPGPGSGQRCPPYRVLGSVVLALGWGRVLGSRTPLASVEEPAFSIGFLRSVPT